MRMNDLCFYFMNFCWYFLPFIGFLINGRAKQIKPEQVSLQAAAELVCKGKVIISTENN